MTLVEESYTFSGALPREELFGLTSQIRRAAVSIPACIAEGYGRDSKGLYVSFLKTAQGSLKELETHLLLTQRLKLGSFEAAEGLLSRCEAIGRMMRGLIRNLHRAQRRHEMIAAFPSMHSDRRLPTADCRQPAEPRQ